MKKTEVTLKSTFKTRSEEHFEILINNKNIGNVWLLFYRGNYWLNNISIDEEYRNQKGKKRNNKFGTKTIKFISQKYNPFKISLSSEFFHNHSHIDGDRRGLKEPGFNLAKSCYREGILLKSNFDYPGDICYFYKEDSFLDNPVYKFMNQFNYKLNKIKSISSKEIKNINRLKN